MPKWEYLFVTCEHKRGEWRPRYVNGQSLRDWEKIDIFYFSNQLGAEGWELVNLMTGHDHVGNTEAYRLVFKRQKP